MTEDEDRPTGPAVWLLDALRVYEEQDAQAKAGRANVFVTQKMQRQPLPRLEEPLDLEPFRPTRGRGAGTAGAGALAVRLYELSRIFLAARLCLYGQDGQAPKQVVMHLCAELLTRSLGIGNHTVLATQSRRLGQISAAVVLGVIQFGVLTLAGLDAFHGLSCNGVVDGQL